MTSEKKKTLLQHAAAMGRDVLTMLAVLAATGSIIATLSRPYWKPFAELPQNVLELQAQVAELISARPRLIDFQGRGSVVGGQAVRPGGQVIILYSLRRNASCDTNVRPFFYNVETGLTVSAATFSAVKAPVTGDFNPFKVAIPIPPTLPPGHYTYYPEIVPVDCGIYGPIRVPPTDIFEVTE